MNIVYQTYRQVCILIMLTLISACSGPIPKSTSLLTAEAAYEQARKNPDVLRYAKDDLNKANASLAAASKAETIEEMDSLAVIADLQIKTAKSVTEGKLGELKFKQLSATKDSLIANALQSKNQQLKQVVGKFEKQAEAARIAEKQRLENQLAALKDKEISRNLKFILGDVLFVTDKADLVPGAAGKINEIADMMKMYPEKTIVIEGHTDNTGNPEYNLDLSQKRADFVKNALIQKGIQNNRIVARGMGQSYPIASNNTKEGRQENRRIEISVKN